MSYWTLQLFEIFSFPSRTPRKRAVRPPKSASCSKQPAYDPIDGAPSRKQPKFAREDDNSISVLLSSHKQLENLSSSQAMYL